MEGEGDVKKKIYRSRSDRFIAGIAGGLGDYFDVDPTIVRLALVALTLLTGFFPTVVIYFLAWVIIPRAQEV